MKRNKKSLLIKIAVLALFAATLLACVFALGACNNHTHQYVQKVTKAPTCYSVGEKTFTCSCGDSYTQVISKLDHSYGSGQVINEASTCGETTVTRYTCSYCADYYDRETVMRHSYLQVAETYVEGDCSNPTTYDERCANCGDVQSIVGDYGQHNPVYFPKKDKTETTDGNRAYWQCTVCQKYFTSKTCETELTADEVFDYAPKYIVLENIDQLLAAILQLEPDTPSEDIYQITLEVMENDAPYLWLTDNITDVIQIHFVTSNLANISEGDVITIKGHLILDDDDSYFFDAEIIRVESSDSELFSMYLTVNDQNLGWVYAESESGEWFQPGLAGPLSLLYGETVTFYCYCLQNGVILQSVTINGKTYTPNSNGEITITVEGDVYAEFVFAIVN